MADEGKDGSWVKDLSHELLQACLAFYDKSPIIGAIGFLFITGSVPLFLLLRFCTNMRRVDNNAVVEKYRIEVNGKSKKRKGKSSKSASAAASTTTPAGG